MPPRTPIQLTVLVCALFWSAAASGQPTPSGDGSPIETSVLRFDVDNVDDPMTDALHKSVVEVIDGHPDMRVSEQSGVTLSELTLTVGCNSRDPSCLSSLAPYVDSRRLVFGSVTRRDDLYRVDVGVFDTKEGRMVYRLQNATARGDADAVRKAIRALVEGMLYGDVGSVEVKVRGGKSARVAFDGELRGPAPTILRELPLGQHTISVTTAEGATKSKVVLVTRQGKTRVLFDFGSPSTAPEPTRSRSMAPGLVVGAVGIGAVALGVFSNVQLNQLDAEANAALQNASGGTSVDTTKLESADGDPRTHVRMTRSASVRAAVGYSVGAVGFAVGTYLIYRAIDTETQTARSAGRNLQIAPSIGRRNVGMRLEISY